MYASIVIPVFRRADWISLCLDAIGKQDFKGEYEVVIVDDGSPNRVEIENVVKSAIQALDIPVQFVRFLNRGPAAARNSGVSLAKGEIVGFVDDDSVPDTGWLTEITKSFEMPDVGLVSGRTCSYDRELSLPLMLEQSVYSGKTFATCNIAYRRTVFDQLGGFDETFPEPSWEDNDLGLRARWAGFKHVYNDKAVVYHPHEASLDEYRAKCLLNGRGAAVFSRKCLRIKPLWGIVTPIIMSRRLLLGLLPNLWFSRRPNISYLKFCWSLYSLKGFLGAIVGVKSE
ncbi:glycosyltransferase [Geobacter pelophilus]|uniref:Glycosyltransferase n=1 Tax=Geoanaerobacter pelophilus TaxID=60036 RepID=A0AAW4L2W1_9BACT|nr:glycosyltransferase [Geoanaerobacter pelophilus]MBT0664547.1 glycosyltransferase [Geoanaerobacter pelophilus]